MYTVHLKKKIYPILIIIFSISQSSLFCKSTLWLWEPDGWRAVLPRRSNHPYLEQGEPGWWWLLGRGIQWSCWGFSICVSGRTYSLRKWRDSVDWRYSGMWKMKHGHGSVSVCSCPALPYRRLGHFSIIASSLQLRKSFDKFWVSFLTIRMVAVKRTWDSKQGKREIFRAAGTLLPTPLKNK